MNQNHFIKRKVSVSEGFSFFSRAISRLSGQPGASILAFAVILVWLISGPLFSFSDTWQLVINTGTTIVTFIMVFLIQNTQNRDGEAIQIKLDELIRSHKGAHNALLDLEELTQEQLERIKARYEKLAKEARENLDQLADTGAPEV